MTAYLNLLSKFDEYTRTEGDLTHLAIFTEDDGISRLLESIGAKKQEGLYILPRSLVDRARYAGMTLYAFNSQISPSPTSREVSVNYGRQLEQIETQGRDKIELFNPFRDNIGRFASGPGRGGGRKKKGKTKTGAEDEGSSGRRDSGRIQEGATGGDIGRQDIDRAVADARSGKSVRSALGMPGRSAIGYGALGAAGLVIAASFLGEGKIASPEKQEETLAEITDLDDKQKERIRAILANRPTYGSLEEATADMTARLKALGVDVPDDIKYRTLVKGITENPLIGLYEPDENTFYMVADMERRVLYGDPMAMHVLAHELAHSSQEISEDEGRTPGTVLDEDTHMYIPQEIYDNRETSSGSWDYVNYLDPAFSYLEGQNELVTMMVLSDLYGTPFTLDVLWRAEEVLYGSSPSDINHKAGYQNEAGAVAFVALAQSDPVSWVMSNHSSAADPESQIVALSSAGVPASPGSFPSWPSDDRNEIDPGRSFITSDLEGWIREHYPNMTAQEGYTAYIEYYLENKP